MSRLALLIVLATLLDAPIATAGSAASATPLAERSSPQLPAGMLSRETPRAGSLVSVVEGGRAPVPNAPPRPTARDDAPLRTQVGPGEPPRAGSPTSLLAASTLALALLLLALYSRILRRADALASPQRAGIVRILHECGPTHVRELAVKLGVHRTTILHHALVLGRLKEVVIVRDGKRPLLALPAHDPKALPPPEPRGAHKLVLEALRGAGGAMRRKDLHARLAMVPLRTRNHAIHHVRGERGDKRGRDALVRGCVRP